MKISYGVNNLRRIQEMEAIEIKPLTILVGKNSAGKSTYLRSFPLLRQSIEMRGSAPILWFGDYVDFGNIQAAVPAIENDEREVNFSFNFHDVDESDKRVSKHKPDFFSWPHIVLSARKFSKFSINHDIAQLRVSVANDKEEDANRPDKTVLKKISFSIFNSTEKEAQKNKHSEFSIYINQGKSDDLEFMGKPYNHIHSEYAQYPVDKLPFLPRMTRSSPFYWERKDDRLKHGRPMDLEDVLNFEINSILSNVEGFADESESEFSFESNSRIDIKLNDKKFVKNLQENYIEEYNSVSELVKFLELILEYDHYVSLLEDELRSVRYLGPARTRGQRFYRSQELQISEIEPDGTNFPTFLNSLDYNKRNEFSRWVESVFDFGVKVEQSIGHISINLLPPNDKTKEVNVADTGYGISQMLPLMGMLWCESTRVVNSNFPTQSSKRIIVIEQPELHLHPAHQAKLADVFSSILENKKLRLVVETHSEALLERIGALIANPSNNLSHEDIQVVVFRSDDDLISPAKVEIAEYNSDGVLENWPYDFFRYEK